MAYLQRIALILFFSIPAFLPNTSFALNYYDWYTTNTINSKSATAEEACNKEVAKQNIGWAPAAPYSYNSVYQQSGWWCKMNASAPAGSGTTSVAIYFSTAPDCTGGQVWNATTHTCGDPPPPPCTKDEPQSYSSPTATGSNQCVNGCVVALDGGRCGHNAAGAQMCFYDGHKTGDTCTTSTATGGTSTNDPAYDCAKQGKSWGTVNGTTVCVKAGTTGSPPVKSVSAGKTTTNTAADGTQTTTQEPPKVTTMSGAPTGSADGTPPKVTEETQNADGTKSTTEESRDKFCETNPNHPICKETDKGSFGGSCAAGFTCDGDAATCAIARETHTRNCEFFKEDAPLNDEFTTLKNGISNNPADVANRTTVNIETSLDATTSLTASCPVDRTFTIMNQPVTIPISNLCDTLEMLGYIFLTVSYIAAARIIGGAV